MKKSLLQSKSLQAGIGGFYIAVFTHPQWTAGDVRWCAVGLFVLVVFSWLAE
jgi:hypothetical protein